MRARLLTSKVSRALYCVVWVGSLLYASSTLAGTEEPAQLADPVFIFRSVLSLAVAGLAWYANRMADKIERLDKALVETDRKVVVLEGINRRINGIDVETHALRSEDVQLQTQINMLRELMLRDYHTKDDTKDHHLAMEKLMVGIREEIRGLCTRVEKLQERIYEERRIAARD